MGFRHRKSVKLPGGFRINLSKSGIGYSWGTKGYRVTKTARGTTRTTMSIPGTGLSYVEESKNPNGVNSGRAPRRLGCLIYVIGIPAIILFAFLTWFLIFREAEEPRQSPPPIPTQSNIQIIPSSEDQRTTTEQIKTYLEGLGYEIVERQGPKYTLVLPGFSVQDVSSPPENWDEIHADFLNAANKIFEEMTSGITLYLEDINRTHCLTIVGEKETYNIFDVEPSAEPSALVGGVSSSSSRTVWVSSAGKRYHRDPDCSGMQNPRSITLGEAQAGGYTACSRCY